MKLIVGLGNPGPKYALTRHNVGFWVIDELASRWKITCDKSAFQGLTAETRIGGHKVLLLKPQTYMNLSGDSVAQVVSYYREIVPNEDILVLYDDMDIAPGKIRLRFKGSSGGHNGMKSLIARLGTDEFPRIRLGVGRPVEHMTVIDHVLSPFTSEEQGLVKEAALKAADAVEFAMQSSFHLAMNRFNG